MPEKRILLVEDDHDIGLLSAHVLRSAGYVVDLVTTRADAWTQLDAQQYMLAIVDWRLPDGDGLIIAASSCWR